MKTVAGTGRWWRWRRGRLDIDEPNTKLVVHVIMDGPTQIWTIRAVYKHLLFTHVGELYYSQQLNGTSTSIDPALVHT